MTGFAIMKRLATMVVLAGLLVLAVAPAASAQSGQGTRSGWERTSAATGGGQTSSTQGQPPQVSVEPRGWEATSTSTTTASRITPSTEPSASFAISSTMVYVAAVVAALVLAIGTAVLLRRQGRPHGLA